MRTSIGISDSHKCVPLNELNRYTPKWAVKVRVIRKSQLTTFQRKRASIGRDDNSLEGKVFSCTVIDAKKTEMEVKFWDSAADRCYGALEIGKAYIMKGGDIQIANQKNNRGNQNGTFYEIVFNHNSQPVIEEVAEEDDALLPSQRELNFTSLRQIKHSARPRPFVTDILAVVKSVQPTGQVLMKARNVMVNRRNVVVVDATGFSMSVTLWNEACDLDIQLDSVISIEGVQIQDYRGRQGGTISSSKISLDAISTPLGKELAEWYSKNKNSEFEQISNLDDGTIPASQNENQTTIHDGTLQEFNDALNKLTVGESVLYRIYGVIDKTYPRRRTEEFTAVYKACMKCNKKLPLEILTDNSVSCPFCNQFGIPVARYGFQVSVSDCSMTGMMSTIFADPVLSLTNVSADKVSEWNQIKTESEIIDTENKSYLEVVNEEEFSIDKYLSNEEKIIKLFEHDLTWKTCVMILKGRKDVFNNETRQSASITSLHKFDAFNSRRVLKTLLAKDSSILDSVSEVTAPLNFETTTNTSETEETEDKKTEDKKTEDKKTEDKKTEDKPYELKEDDCEENDENENTFNKNNKNENIDKMSNEIEVIKKRKRETLTDENDQSNKRSCVNAD